MSEKPTRKTKARAAEQFRQRAQQERNRKLKTWIPIVVIGMLVVAFAAFVFASSTVNSTSGTPHLQVDSEKIDLGKQIFNKPVRAAFTVKNDGDGTLTLNTPPRGRCA